MKTTEFDGIARRVLNVFFVIDTSGSMAGTAIAQVNMGIQNTIDTLKQEAHTADAQLKLAVLEFNSGATWLNPAGPQDIEDFMFVNPLEAGGLTDMGAALSELDSKLSRSAYLDSITGNYLPLIIFLSDGQPTDDYMKALKNIRNNKWFTRARKIAFAVGDAPDITMLANVTGSIESVIKMEDLSQLAKLITFASVTASMVQSQSRVDTSDDTSELITSIIDGLDGAEVATTTDVDQGEYVPEPVEPPVDPSAPVDPNADPWAGW